MTSPPVVAQVPDDVLEAIRIGCEGVTPGDWRVHARLDEEIGTYVYAKGNPGEDLILIADCYDGSGDHSKAAANAAHFARLNRATVLSIVTELQSLRQPNQVTRLVEATRELLDAAAAATHVAATDTAEWKKTAVRYAEAVLAAQNALRDALSPFPSIHQQGWKDIETAPKDGTVIDLLIDGERYANCRWLDTPYDEDFDGAWVRYPSGNYAVGEDQTVTHWMPLPAPPANGGAE